MLSLSKFHNTWIVVIRRAGDTGKGAILKIGLTKEQAEAVAARLNSNSKAYNHWAMSQEEY